MNAKYRTTENILTAFRKKYIQWGRITIPYGSSRKDRGTCVYHLPNRIEEPNPLKALTIMYKIYRTQNIDIGAPEPTEVNLALYLQNQQETLSCAQSSITGS